MFSSAQVDVTKLRETAPNVRLVVALDWFSPERAMTGADGRPRVAAYFPYADTLWFDGNEVVYSPYLDDVSELGPGWRGVRSVDEMISALLTASAH